MARDYDMQIEVRNITEEEAKKIEVALKTHEDKWIEEGANIDVYEDEGKIRLVVDQPLTLTIGTDCKDADADIKKIVKAIIPHAKIGTRWHYADWTDWDEEFVEDLGEDDEQTSGAENERAN